MIAFSGRGGALVDQLVFECSGGAPFARIACPAGAGDGLDGLALGCAPITF